MRTGLALLALLACSCSDEMPSMRIYDGVADRFDKPVALDWTFIGGDAGRRDRLLLVGDGHARRHKRGNLLTRASMTADERKRLDALRARCARIDDQHHGSTPAGKRFAWRLRFDGRGDEANCPAVRAFAERVLARLAPAALAQEADLLVDAVVASRDRDGRSTLVVKRVRADRHHTGVTPGARIAVVLPEAREGVGGTRTPFSLHGLSRDGDTWRADRIAYIKKLPTAPPP